MSSEIGNKTPSQVFNDLFYLNNGNEGVDLTPRSLYSGNGIPTPLKIGADKLEADFNKGDLVRPVLGPSYWKFKDIGEVTGSCNINTDNGNIQKVKLVGDISLTITTDSPSTVVFELTLIVEQGGAGSFSVTLPGNFKTPSTAPVKIRLALGLITIVKFLTYDGGANWLAWRSA